MTIRQKKQKLKQAIREDNLKAAIEISKQLGLSMQYICKAANVNVGNLCSFINGKLLSFNDEYRKQVYKVIGDILLNEI